MDTDTDTETEVFPPVGPNFARVLLYCLQEIPEAQDPALYFYRKPDGGWGLNIGESKSLPPRAVIITRTQLVEFLAGCGIPDDHEHPGIDSNMLVSLHLAARAENAIEAIRSEPEAGSKSPERLADIRQWAAQDFDMVSDQFLSYKMLMMLREVLGDYLPESVAFQRVSGRITYRTPDSVTVYEVQEEGEEAAYTAADGGGYIPGTYPTLQAAYDAVVAYRADPVGFLLPRTEGVSPSVGPPEPYWYHSDEAHWQLMRGGVWLGYVLHYEPLGTVPGGWRAYRCVEWPGMSEEQVLGSYGTAELAKAHLWDEVAASEAAV